MQLISLSNNQLRDFTGHTQVPFRFTHCSRSNCGRGYSARGVSALKQDQLFSMNSIAAAKSFFIVIVCLSPSFPSTCRQERKEDLCMNIELLL